MKAKSLVSVVVVLLVALAIAVALMTGQLMTTHASDINTSHKANKMTNTSTNNQTVKTANITIPPQLAVPAGNVLIGHLFGKGVLVFACPSNANSAEVPIIILSQNAAGTKTAGSHFLDIAGLVWEGLNGDRVVAAPLAKVVVNVNSAPWVLLQAQSNTGVGMFANVTFIQRVMTVGGLPPNGCANPQNQAEVEVPFTTQYLFYGRT